MDTFETLITEDVASREMQDLIVGTSISNAIDVLIDNEAKKLSNSVKITSFHVPDEIPGIEVVDGAFDPDDLFNIKIPGLENVEHELDKSQDEAIPVEFSDEENKDIKDIVYGAPGEDREHVELDDEVRGTDAVLKSLENEE